jgi:hypothetical protein
VVEENQVPKPVFIRLMAPEIRSGEPLQVSELMEEADPQPLSTLADAMSVALKAYRKAAHELLKGQFASVRALAPPHQLRRSRVDAASISVAVAIPRLRPLLLPSGGLGLLDLRAKLGRWLGPQRHCRDNLEAIRPARLRNVRLAAELPPSPLA